MPKNLVSLVFAMVLAISLGLTSPSDVLAATSPTLTGASGYSVLGGAAVTNVGTTTATGAVGVSPGTSIDGGITAGGGTHSNDASAIAAQADAVSAFAALDAGANADANCIGGVLADNTDLTTLSPLVAGLYCSAGSFRITGNLTLTGTSGVWVFKTVSTLITSSASSVTGGDPCNVWWRVGSAATLGTTTSFIGNIVTANVADTTALNTGTTLNGRVLGQAAQTVALFGNTITGPTCTAASSSSSSSSSSSVGSSIGGAPVAPYCPTLSTQIVPPNIIESRRISPTSIFISWAPFSGVNTFNVQYGLENGKWLYSANVTGFSTTINNLPANQPIWVRVAARSDCRVGGYGAAKLIGGPGLPNTGLAPQNKNNPWDTAAIPAGIVLTVLTSIVIVLRKRTV